MYIERFTGPLFNILSNKSRTLRGYTPILVQRKNKYIKSCIYILENRGKFNYDKHYRKL